MAYDGCCGCYVLFTFFHVSAFRSLSSLSETVIGHQGIMADVQGSKVLYIPGVMTPTEVSPA